MSGRMNGMIGALLLDYLHSLFSLTDIFHINRTS